LKGAGMEIELKDPPLWKRVVICAPDRFESWYDISGSSGSTYFNYRIIGDDMCPNNISYVFDKDGNMQTWEHVYDI
jgi:hypothetical protein